MNSEANTETLITYIGNKRSIVSDILKQVESIKKNLNKRKIRFADVFSGSTAVAQAVLPHCNYLEAIDKEPYFKAVADRFLRTDNKNFDKLVALRKASLGGIEFDHKAEPTVTDGWFRTHYAPADESNISPHDRVFYTVKNAQIIDTYKKAVKDYCDFMAGPKSTSDFVYNYFIAPLIIQASIHCNTCGVFKGFYRGKDRCGKFGGEAENALPRITGKINVDYGMGGYDEEVEKRAINVKTKAVLADVNEYFLNYKGKEFDVAYIDPPYNQHPYGSNYFMLNFIADRTEAYKELKESDFSSASGIPNNWNRSGYNNKDLQPKLLKNLIDIIPAKYVILSYNSTGFLSVDKIQSIVEGYSFDKIAIPYIQFRGSRNFDNSKKDVTEFLFLIKK